MKRNQTIRDSIDECMWIASIDNDEAKQSVLDMVAKLREKYGKGWWDNTLNHLEQIACKKSSNMKE